MLDRTRIALIAVLVVGPHVLTGQGKTVSATLATSGSRTAAPEIVLKDSSNRMVRLSDYRGHVVLLDFWATKCGGCVEEIPSFIEIASAYETRGLRTLGVSEDIIYENLTSAADAWGQVRPFVRDHKVTYPVVVDDQQVHRKYDITALPLTYLIDRHGRIAATYAGIVDRANLEGNIERLLEESGR
ncbi:MAG: TlpA family protein disulfide reductase [Dehalococcoidia bacterium]|nr:TlpA family protein disulfide reductase [Dehalococcoidia bacterium]